ncbi:MAG: hypothetical protein ABIN89_00605 [Chitinophagaceae bacterium]
MKFYEVSKSITNIGGAIISCRCHSLGDELDKSCPLGLKVAKLWAVIVVIMNDRVMDGDFNIIGRLYGNETT